MSHASVFRCRPQPARQEDFSPVLIGEVRVADCLPLLSIKIGNFSPLLIGDDQDVTMLYCAEKHLNGVFADDRSQSCSFLEIGESHLNSMRRFSHSSRFLALLISVQTHSLFMLCSERTNSKRKT
jgi:hypothetical protein